MNMTAYETSWTPLYEYVVAPTKPNVVHPVENTQDLLQEFETVYKEIHYTHLSPQPQVKPPVLFQQQLTPNTVPYYNNNNEVNFYSVPAPFPTVETAPEIEFVDEIVRSRYQDMELPDSWQDDNTCSSSSYSSSGLSPSHSESDSCYGGSGFSDEEYGRRSKPYDRPMMDEKRSRKKEQNKNAATRYRQKKKQEVEEILTEEKKLSEVNDKLLKQYGDIKREVNYLKSLMRELFKQKGLLD